MLQSRGELDLPLETLSAERMAQVGCNTLIATLRSCLMSCAR
jgi:hypothetical protein